MANLHLDLDNSTTEQQIAQFKSDPDQMEEINQFLNEIFEIAQIEVEKRNQLDKPKSKLMERRNLDYGRAVLKRLPALLRPEFLPQYAIVPIQCGVLLVLAAAIIRKYIWKPSLK